MKHLPLVVLALALFVPQRVSAQHADRTFHRFRMLLNSGDRIEGTDGILSDTTFRGRANAGNSIDVPRASIRALDVSTSSEAGKYAAIGAGLGLLTGLLAIAQVSADPTRVLNTDAATAVTAALTVGGGLSGLAVGSGQRRWESVPLRTALRIAPDAKGVMFGARVSF